MKLRITYKRSKKEKRKKIKTKRQKGHEVPKRGKKKVSHRM
jgi:hypothetical protein